jgi:hypothetical protein
MKLADLDPRWLGAGGDGVTRADGSPAPERHGVGIIFECPCGRSEHDDGGSHAIAIEFDRPLDGGPAHRTDGKVWQRTGETFETLTLSPSIQRIGGCGWHGWIRNGEVISC